MAVRIRSLVTSGPVQVPLATGSSVRLSPGQVSDDIPDVEVANNAKVDKLRQQGLIDLEQAEESEQADPAAADAAPDDEQQRSRGRKRAASSG